MTDEVGIWLILLATLVFIISVVHEIGTNENEHWKG
jgi:hypothetical protein